MPPNDKNSVRKGQFITGDAYPGVAKIDGHIVYGQRLKPKTSEAQAHVASVAGMTLPQMQQFVIGNFHLPPDKLEKLARRMRICEEEKKP